MLQKPEYIFCFAFDLIALSLSPSLNMPSKTDLSLLFIVAILILAHVAYLDLNTWRLPKLWIQKPLHISGKIISVPVAKFHGEQFQFKTSCINHRNIKAKLLLRWYQKPPPLMAGEKWRFTASLKPPVGTHNPGGFDYAAYLRHQGIVATGTVHQGNKLQKAAWPNLNALRQKIQHNIARVVKNPTLAAFVSALSVGLRAGLTQQDWQIFQKTGTNHLIAIAGLHIGFVAAIFYWLGNFLWRRSSRLLLFYPAQKAAEILAFLGAFLYALLSGFALPAERTILMLFCFLLATLLDRSASLWRRLIFAICVILLIDPFSIFDSSFWLSVASLFWIGWVLSGRLKAQGHLKSLFKMQLGIILGLLPLMALYFQQISLIAFFTNALAIPWVGFVILPIILFALSFYFLQLKIASQFLFAFAGKCLWPLWHFLIFSAALPFARFHLVIFHDWILIFAVVGLLFLLAPRYFPCKKYVVFGLLPLFFYQPSHPKPHHFWVSVIDVGQGLSVLVQTARHVMLYDTGARYPGGFDFGEAVVTPYLRLQNVHTIDRLEISHGDNDHSGGMSAILHNFKVKTVFTSAPNLVKQFHAQYCRAGQNWEWDGVQFTTLNPLDKKYEDNNSSCVIKIDDGKKNILLTGDIQASAEKALVKKYGTLLKSTVLVSPHHGSQTSSTSAFLRAVSPRIVVISAGKYNVYHLPSKPVLTRYKKDHFKVLNTADLGRVRVKFGRAAIIS